jgi:hypothetical protein
MGFYELGNGCDSCDTVSSILPNNVNSNQYSGSYGTQGGNSNQYNTGMVSSGYAQGGAMGSMGNGSNGSTMGTPTIGTSMGTATMVVPVTTTQKKQVQVQVPGPAQVLVPATGSSKGKMSVEGFADSAGASDTMSNDKKWIILGLVIFTALAGNECCKYFLNKSLQLNDGSPMYYVAYAGVAVLLTFAAHTYVSKN